jgi:hypothetical protein
MNPEPIPFVEDIKFKNISCGDFHSLLLSEDVILLNFLK